MLRSLTAFLLVTALPHQALTQSRPAVVVVAHGADSTWNAPVAALVADLSERWPSGAVYLMGPASRQDRFQDVVASLVAQGADHVVILPLLVSSHSGHFRQIAWLAGQRDDLDSVMREHLHHAGHTRATTAPMTLLPALDDAPEMADVLAERVRHLLAGVDPAERAVMLVGHGPNGTEDHAAWMTAFRVQAERLRAALGLADVRVGVVRDDAPPPVRAEAVRSVRDLIALQARVTGHPVLAVPVLISTGALNRARLPEDLAGLPVEYSPVPLLPHAAIRAWALRSIEQAVAPRTD